MTYPLVTERWQDRTVDVMITTATAVRAWDIVTATADDYAQAYTGLVTAAPLNASHPDFSSLKVKKQSLRPVGPAVYIGNATYESPEVIGGQNPTSLATEWTFDIVSQNTTIEEDVSHNPIRNSIYEPFDTPPTGAFTYITATATKYLSSISLGTLITYVNKTNSGSWNFGYGSLSTGQAICRGIHPAKVTISSNTYYKVTYEFELRSDGFPLRILDQGYRHYISGGAGLQSSYDWIVGPDNQPVNRPQLLNGKGKQLAQTGGTDTPPGATLDTTNPAAVWLKYTIFGTADFSALGL